MPLFGSSNSCTKRHGAPASLAEAARDARQQRGLRQPSENMDLVFIFNFVELGPDILECDASWYVPVIGAIMRQLLKFPMRWSSGADLFSESNEGNAGLE